MSSSEKHERTLRWLVKRFLFVYGLEGGEVLITYLHNGEVSVIYSKSVDDDSIESKSMVFTGFPSMGSVIEVLLLFGFEILQESGTPTAAILGGCGWVHSCNSHEEVNPQKEVYILFKGRAVGTISVEPL